MHILLIHQAFVSQDEAGGTRHYELARYLTTRGNRFTVIASNLSYLTGRPTDTGNRLVNEQLLGDVRVLRAYTYPSLHQNFAWRVICFFIFAFTSLVTALRAGPVDVVMGTSPPIFQAVSAWLVSVVRRRPFLLEIRDLWPEFAIGMGVLDNPLLIVIARWVERFLYSRATHVLVNSPAYLDYLLGKGVPANKTTLIPNGVNPEMFDPNAKGDHVRQEFGLDSQFIVTYAGALGLANDIPVILRAANHLRDLTNVHFLLVGDGKERMNLEALARDMELPNVTFTGARPKLEIPEILASSNACVATLKDIPMFRTTYPNKVFDYMAAGRPIILAIDGVIRQVVESANAGIFVAPGDDVALSEAIKWLANNRVEAQAMGKTARSHVVKHFNRNGQAQAFLELTARLSC